MARRVPVLLWVVATFVAVGITIGVAAWPVIRARELVLSAEEAARQGRFDEALEYARSAVEMRADQRGYLVLSRLLDRDRQYEAALVAVTRAIERGADGREAHGRKGQLMILLDRDPTEALVHLNAALQRSGRVGHELLLSVAVARDRTGDLVGAEQAATMAIEMLPEPRRLAHFERALIRLHAGALEGARADAVMAVRLSASEIDLASAHNLLGLVETARREYTAAIAAFSSALEANPDLVAARVNRARALMEDGELVQAQSELVASLEVVPTKHRGMVEELLGEVRRRLDDETE